MVPRRPRVLVTRAEGDEATLTRGLLALGCEPVVAPMIRREVLQAELRRGLAACPAPDVLLVTSPATFAALDGVRAALRPGRVACVGPATAAAAAALGLRVDVVPDTATGAATVAALGDLSGQTVLYVTAEHPVPTTRVALDAAGARVVQVTAYRTAPHPDRRRHAAEAGAVDLVTLTAPSVARAWAEVAGPRLGTPVVAIGPTTAEAAAAVGLRVVAVAAPHTAEGLVAAVGATLRARGSGR